jgi:hypothetical protein
MMVVLCDTGEELCKCFVADVLLCGGCNAMCLKLLVRSNVVGVMMVYG